MWRYNFDHENRLTFAKNRRERVNYQYDALGRRVKTSNFLKGSTKYTYDGLDVVQDDDSSTGITKYQNGLGIDNKLKLKNGANSSYFLADHLGSTNGLVNSSGSLTSSASYDSFGNPTGNLATRYQFTGREKDDVTGLYYYRARFYDAKLGRFISEDPIGFAGGDVNLYGYVWNNPQNFTDPSGLRGGWGTNTADYLDDKIEYARQSYQRDVQNWLWNGSVNTVADLSSGVADLFRVGNGLGQALYCEDNIYGKGAFIAMDVARAAGIAGIVGGVGARFGGKFGNAPRGNISPQPPQQPPINAPNFLGQSNGPAIPIPKGASPTPIINPGGKTTGFGYKGGSGGGNGLDPKVNGVRVMNPTQPKGPSPGYPNGYVNYSNKSGQSVNPYTGQTVPKNSPWWHIQLD